MINFIPNDPLATLLIGMRSKQPRRNRTASQAGFTFSGVAPQGQFNPGTAGFLFWQCRESALLAIEVYEQLHGPLRRWVNNKAKLKLLQDEGEDLNAFYDRSSLAFFHHKTGTKTTFSGASTDVVAHEAGHGFFDELRPQLWFSSMTEHGAFHEAFGDCIAILVALFDSQTRTALLAKSPNLGTANLVEATAEDLSDGVRRAIGPQHSASAPRRALNNFKFKLPTTLPVDGPPSVLTSEIHSFARLFSGCFYDVIRNIFNDSTRKNSTALLAAARTAGKLLVQAAAQASPVSRFFQSVGRAMVLADDATNGGANRQAIGLAFARHDIMLGSSSALMPKASLAGAAPTAAALAPATVKDLRQRLGMHSSERMIVNRVKVGSEQMLEALHQREVPLASLTKDLKGVVALAAEAVVIGSSGNTAAVFNAIPDEATTTGEVLKFVETLLAHNRISFEKPASKTAKKSATAAAVIAKAEPGEAPTHVIATKGGKKTLVRIRFACH